MNPLARRLLVATALVLGVLQTVENVHTIWELGMSTPKLDIDEPMIPLHIVDRMGELEHTAGDRHPAVGPDPFSCRLCLMPEAHPIHQTEPV